AVVKIITRSNIEKNLEPESKYTIVRDDCRPQDTLSHEGKGAPVGYTGMTWSGFRPSDDACVYGYLVPANMFAVVVLNQLAEIAKDALDDEALAKTATDLAAEIDQGIQKYGKVEHPEFGTIYAYETDGLGNHNLMDDANVPSRPAPPY